MIGAAVADRVFAGNVQISICWPDDADFGNRPEWVRAGSLRYTGDTIMFVKRLSDRENDIVTWEDD